jgi:hypothetical protein
LRNRKLVNLDKTTGVNRIVDMASAPISTYVSVNFIEFRFTMVLCDTEIEVEILLIDVVRLEISKNVRGPI